MKLGWDLIRLSTITDKMSMNGISLQFDLCYWPSSSASIVNEARSFVLPNMVI